MPYGKPSAPPTFPFASVAKTSANQVIPYLVLTKVTWPNVIQNPNSIYNAALSRITLNQVGTWLVSASLALQTDLAGVGGFWNAYIYRNGVAYTTMTFTFPPDFSGNPDNRELDFLVPATAVTDYVEIFVYNSLINPTATIYNTSYFFAIYQGAPT